MLPGEKEDVTLVPLAYSGKPTRSTGLPWRDTAVDIRWLYGHRRDRTVAGMLHTVTPGTVYRAGRGRGFTWPIRHVKDGDGNIWWETQAYNYDTNRWSPWLAVDPRASKWPGQKPWRT